MHLLKDVLSLINIKSDIRIEVKGITNDSRKVKEGYIFYATNGNHHKVNEFIKDAFKNGAIAIINEEIEDEFIYKIPNLKDKLSMIAKYIYDLDFSSFNCYGFTGTNGKTTTTSLIHKVLRNKEIDVTLIGTNGVYFNDDHYELNNTTPSLLELYSIFYESKKRNIKNIIMEVSSHAIELKRIEGIKFDIIGFTNISHDHLDFHKTIENYAKAKYKLTNYLKKDGLIIYNIDDKCIKNFDFSNYRKLSFGIYDGDFKIENIRLSIDGSTFFIDNKQISSSLSCMFNVYNLSMAYLTLINMKIKPNDVIRSIKQIKSIDGRMQNININNRYIYIDFAHSPDSIEKVISFIKPLAKKKIIVVFGAGGDRDKTKRPKMLDVCLKYADKVYVTSDNPRYENPNDIIKDVIRNKMSYKVNKYLSREDAIKDAIKYSNEFDTILLLGKGNETYQIINDIKIPYSDIEVVESCISN